MSKITGRAAQIMEQFNSSAAKLNNGTIVIGGRVEAPTARKLVRLGLIEQVRESRVVFRATDAGREWLATNAETTDPGRILAETAALDIPAAIRAHVEAGWRGDESAMDEIRDAVMTALLAADPKLSNTAATFRFHNLVAEMRDNGEISPDTLARITAERV